MTVAALEPKRRRRMEPPAPADPVTAYALDVVAGRVVAGRLVRLACERHLRDLATGAERGLYFDVKAAMRAINFPPLLRHYKGEWAKRPIILEPWEKFALGSAFGWKRADGSRRFRSVYLEVAKKNGKTLLAALVGILLAFFDKEPGAEVYAIATKRDQAKFVWGDADQLIRRSVTLSKRIQRYTLSLVDHVSASFFKPLGRDSGEGDQGINAHGAIVDELHVIDDRDSIDNVESSMSARRQPMIWKITTAGKKRISVWWEERTDAVAVVEGRATDDSMLVLVYTLDEGDDPFDEAVWPKSNPNLGVSVSIDFLRDQAAKALRSPGRMAAFLQLRMNVPTQQSQKAIDMGIWDSCDGRLVDEDTGLPTETYEEFVQRVIPDGSRVYGGLDLASVTDLTASVDAYLDDEGFLNLAARFYCPEDGISARSQHDGVPYDDWRRDGFLIATPGGHNPGERGVTDYDWIRGDEKQVAERWQVEEIGYDKWNATQLATDLRADGATMIEIPQTHAGLSPGWSAIERFLLSVKIRHGGNPVLRWMAENVETELDQAGNAKPSKRRSSERIDGIVAADMAVARLITHQLAADEFFIAVGSGR